MRISSLLATGLVFVALTGTALSAHEGMRGGYDRAEPTSRADMLASVSQRFDMIDTNKDDMIDATEMAAYRDQMKQRRAERMAARATAGDAETSEGAKSRWHERRGKRMGAWAEKGAGNADGTRGGWLSRLDTDNDGMISREEFAAPALKRFDRVDADGDGIVTPQERAAAREARKAKRN